MSDLTDLLTESLGKSWKYILGGSSLVLVMAPQVVALWNNVFDLRKKTRHLEVERANLEITKLRLEIDSLRKALGLSGALPSAPAPASAEAPAAIEPFTGAPAPPSSGAPSGVGASVVRPGVAKRVSRAPMWMRGRPVLWSVVLGGVQVVSAAIMIPFALLAIATPLVIPASTDNDKFTPGMIVALVIVYLLVSLGFFLLFRWARAVRLSLREPAAASA